MTWEAGAMLTKVEFMHPQLQGWRWAGPRVPRPCGLSRVCGHVIWAVTQTHPQNSHTIGLTFCCCHLEIHNTFFWQAALHFYFALGSADRVASPACRASEKRNFTWSCWAKRPHGKGKGPPRCRSDASKHHRARRWSLEVPASPSSPLMRKVSRQTQTGVGEGLEVVISPTICLSRSVNTWFSLWLGPWVLFQPHPGPVAII